MNPLTLEELRRLCGGGRRPPRGRPRCQHVSFDRVACRRPAEHECDPGPDGLRPRYVCGVCLMYQVAAVGPLSWFDDTRPVRVDGEGKIVARRRRP